MASRAYNLTPLDTMLATIPSLPRPMLARLVSRMIEQMDEIDGDPDTEQNGDEDDFLLHLSDGPGCPISDAGGGNCEDEGESDWAMN